MDGQIEPISTMAIELRKLPGFGAVQGLPAFAVIGEAE